MVTNPEMVLAHFCTTQPSLFSSLFVDCFVRPPCVLNCSTLITQSVCLLLLAAAPDGMSPDWPHGLNAMTFVASAHRWHLVRIKVSLLPIGLHKYQNHVLIILSGPQGRLQLQELAYP